MNDFVHYHQLLSCCKLLLCASDRLLPEPNRQKFLTKQPILPKLSLPKLRDFFKVGLFFYTAHVFQRHR